MLLASPSFPGAVQDTERCTLALSDDTYPVAGGMQYAVLGAFIYQSLNQLIIAIILLINCA